MGSNYISRIGWFIGLILLQVLVLNNVHIAGYGTPFLYVYFILKFNSGTSRNALLLWGFLIGVLIDIFSNTPGMNAAATVLLAFVCPFFLRIFVPRDNLDIIVPSISTMGVFPFFKYLLTCVFIHHLALFSVEFFSLASFTSLILSVLVSTLLTVVCMMAIEGIKR